MRWMCNFHFMRNRSSSNFVGPNWRKSSTRPIASRMRVKNPRHYGTSAPRPTANTRRYCRPSRNSVEPSMIMKRWVWEKMINFFKDLVLHSFYIFYEKTKDVGVGGEGRDQRRHSRRDWGFTAAKRLLDHRAAGPDEWTRNVRNRLSFYAKSVRRFPSKNFRFFLAAGKDSWKNCRIAWKSTNQRAKLCYGKWYD